LQQLAADPQTQAIAQAQAGPTPDDVSGWLADLQELVGVPFTYLVPDARMLPAESIRFFVVDPNWTTAMVDGALSLAARTAPTAAAIQALRPGALAASRRVAASRWRPATASAPARAAAEQSAATAAPAYSGFLLRSAAVSDWPGLRVSGYADTQVASPTLPIVRLERLAPTILLALFAGLIQHVEIAEPAQHLHFGITSDTGGLTVSVRLIDQARAGEQPAGNPTAPVSLRPDPNRAVINVTATVAAVTQALAPAYPPPQAVPSLEAAALSLQLLQAPSSQPFIVAGGAAPAVAAPDPSGTTP
jgi:hypothetical protein